MWRLSLWSRGGIMPARSTSPTPRRPNFGRSVWTPQPSSQYFRQSEVFCRACGISSCSGHRCRAPSAIFGERNLVRLVTGTTTCCVGGAFWLSLEWQVEAWQLWNFVAHRLLHCSKEINLVLEQALWTSAVQCEEVNLEQVTSSREVQECVSCKEVSPARVRVFREVLCVAVQHWLSLCTLTIATLVSIVVERIALAGQVQQLIQLPGQMPTDAVLSNLAMIFGVKAVHLCAEALRAAVSHRLGQQLESKSRHHLNKQQWFAVLNGSHGEVKKPSSSNSDLMHAFQGGNKTASHELATATRLIIVDAAPRLVVEILFTMAGAIGALSTSPVLAMYFVAHETLVGQLIGFGAAALTSRRDHKTKRAYDARQDWEQRRTENADHVDRSEIDANDAQFVLEKYMDAGQLVGLGSFVFTVSVLMDRGLTNAIKYQKVMMFASNAMQSTSELAAAAERLHHGTELLGTVLAFDDAIRDPSDSETSPRASNTESIQVKVA